MKSLQRLQQNILASDETFGRGIALTPRAERLRAAFRRGLVVGMATTAALTGAAAYVRVGPGSYDPQKLYLGDANNSQVMASIFDHHRALLAARERVQEIKFAMIAGDGPASLEEQASELRQAKAVEHKLASEFSLQTHSLSQEQIRQIVGADDVPQAETVAESTPRFRP